MPPDILASHPTEDIETVGVAPAGYFDSPDYAGRSWRAYVDILGDAIRYSQPGPMVDLGAGAGFLVEAAQRWGLECEGLEGSTDAIEAARARYGEIRLRHGLLGDPLPWPDASVATVFLNQVIEHLAPEVGERVLREAGRVLRPGGMAYITSPSRFDRHALASDSTHIYLYSPSELRALLLQCGFSRVLDRNIPLPFFGRSKIGRLLATGLFRLVPFERLSATADFIAYT